MKIETINKANKLLNEISIMNEKIDYFNNIAENTFSIAFYSKEHKQCYPTFEVSEMKENNNIDFPTAGEFFSFWKSLLVAKRSRLEKELDELQD